jgi:hypothetical protein
MIPKAELSRFYQKTAQSYGRQRSDGEVEAWLDTISSYRSLDLDAALRRWHADTSIEEFTGKPRGSRMPTPAELKLSIDGFAQEERKQITGKFQPCGNCQSGWVRIFHGTTIEANPIDEKTGAVRRCECFLRYAAAKKGRAT